MKLNLSEKPINPLYDNIFRQHTSGEETIVYEGMTLLEYYAGLAMQGIIVDLTATINHERLAKEAVTIAKALIEQLEKEK